MLTPGARPDRSQERARQDYVKAIFQLGNDSPVAGADLARYLTVSRAAVTKSRRLLEKEGLVKRAASRVDRIELTERGRRLALSLMRRHRLIETFLHRTLHVPLDDLHPQAEAIEHVISDEVAERLARFLRNPRVDPHGHPIVTASRGAGRSLSQSLADVKPGTRIRVESIPDRDASVVRQLSAQGVLPGHRATVAGRDKGGVRIRSARGANLIAPSVAASILISIEKPRRSAR
jgi:DtxR family transcriptional regulator, Mn-dependent transcriptional regulator